MRTLFALLIFVFISSPKIVGQRTYTINKAIDKIEVDGQLNELSWINAQKADNFVENYPDFGGKPSFESAFYLTYTDEAVYFAGKVYDNPDSVGYIMSQRDNFGNADWVGITIDCYGNFLNANSFYITAAGVELDAAQDVLNDDFSWNSVWKSVVERNDDGWTFEALIPYAALRFPNKEIQDWNINFVRQIRRKREMSFWNPVDPAAYGEITQTGKLLNLKNIKPPLRLSFSPYGITYSESVFDPVKEKQVFQSRTIGGMDLKWGINGAFTLDMALIPDFGQTISDNQILNLGPFEVQFDENRSFFQEGTELFGIGDVFYSRRVGGEPFYKNNLTAQVDESKGERITQSVTQAPLLNGTKVSGRTKSGLGIGLFNAVEGRTDGFITDSLGNTRAIRTNPLTNYTVVALSQNLKNNGKFSLLNSNVTRESNARDANVSVASTELFSKDLKYGFGSTFKLSSILENQQNSLGYSYDVSLKKVQGRFQYEFYHGVENDTYDPNDLGFLLNNNSQWIGLSSSWNTFTQKGRLLRSWINTDIFYEELFAPRLFSNMNIKASANGTFRNFLTGGFGFEIAPLGTVDHFESREFGMPLNFAPSAMITSFYSSDYSKPFALDINVRHRQFFEENMTYSRLTISPRFQFSPRIFMVYSAQYEYFKNDYGFVAPMSSANLSAIQIGTRNRDIVTNSLNAEFVFSKLMGLTIRFRHYWQRLDYQYFSDLQTDGSRMKNDYFPLNQEANSFHNRSFNAFTIDIDYRWVFFPGCQFQIFFKNNIFNSIDGLDRNYFATFSTLFDSPQLNSISGRVLLFVDALYFKKNGLKTML